MNFEEGIPYAGKHTAGLIFNFAIDILNIAFLVFACRE